MVFLKDIFKHIKTSADDIKACKITQGAKRTYKYKNHKFGAIYLTYQKDLDRNKPFKRNCQLDQYAMPKFADNYENTGLNIG